MNNTTAIAISGGIDSLIAAYLLKKQGKDIIAFHFLTGYEKESPDLIKSVTKQLDIDLKIIDCREIFKKKVIDYFIQTYQAGKTPNPCIVCNPCIKFGAIPELLNKEFGISRIATGHYARVTRDNDGKYHLFKGIDAEKDQSYFLAFLAQKQLSAACFPLGNITKSDVKKLAEENGLNPVVKKESQDICFIRETTYGEFLTQHGVKSEPGVIEDINGKILGEHKGLYLFTIGQRRGINCPASEPYYVVKTDMNQNRLIVGFKKDLYSSECRVEKINWICHEPTAPISLYTRVRYRHKAVSSTLFPIDKDKAIIRFESPESAVTPGQGAVFYQDDEVIGGGFIC